MADSEVGGGARLAGGPPTEAAASEAFALLGNETRLGILLAIWEEQVPLAEDNAVPFSRIFDRVAIDDRGNFSYHLDKLEGRFVTQHAERGGYELLIPGLKLVRTIVAGTGISDAELEPTEINQPCPRCGGRTRIFYRWGVVFLQCTECRGTAPPSTEVDGLLTAVYFEPAGVADRTPEELHTASVAAALQQARSFAHGVCPTCSGPVDGRLLACDDHDSSEGHCEACGRLEPVTARRECRICKNFGGGTLRRLALFHPAVVSLYDDHGVSTRVRADDHEAAREVYERMNSHEVELVSADPPRAAVTVRLGDDEVRLTVDETAQIVDVAR